MRWGLIACDKCRTGRKIEHNKRRTGYIDRQFASISILLDDYNLMFLVNDLEGFETFQFVNHSTNSNNYKNSMLLATDFVPRVNLHSFAALRTSSLSKWR
jgi:hypothetical protein